MTEVCKVIRVMAIAIAVLSVAGLRPASAQFAQVKQLLDREWTDMGFITISGGAQPTARSLRTTGSTPLFGETATWDSTVGVGSAGLFDLNGGYRVWRNVAVALGYSRYSDTSSVGVTASIPDPLFFDMATVENLTGSGLSHSENALHLSAAYVLPITDRIDVTVLGGPTFFFVKKDVVSDITVTDGTLASATRTRLEETTTGGHFTLDVRYRLLGPRWGLQHIGAGIFVRYTGGSIDGGSVGAGDIGVGGFNYGAGVRIGF